METDTVEPQDYTENRLIIVFTRSDLDFLNEVDNDNQCMQPKLAM